MKKIVHIPENELKIKYHPNSCYTSRKIKYSAKLNEYLSQDSLSDKIVIMNYDNTEMNEYFENATTNDFSKILAIGRVDSRIALKARNKYELFEWTPYTPYTQ
ncbi:12811_t:CDS:2 [Rhizophagus irregularis]|nr:12811_t:CDS:2 [Rhizophagus irregularis]